MAYLLFQFLVVRPVLIEKGMDPTVFELTAFLLHPAVLLLTGPDKQSFPVLKRGDVPFFKQRVVSELNSVSNVQLLR